MCMRTSTLIATWLLVPPSLSFICTAWCDKTNLSCRTNLATWIKLEIPLHPDSESRRRSRDFRCLSCLTFKVWQYFVLKDFCGFESFQWGKESQGFRSILFYLQCIDSWWRRDKTLFYDDHVSQNGETQSLFSSQLQNLPLLWSKFRLLPDPSFSPISGTPVPTTTCSVRTWSTARSTPTSSSTSSTPATCGDCGTWSKATLRRISSPILPHLAS